MLKKGAGSPTATLSFFARSVGNIAGGNKPVLDNLNKSPTLQITFTDQGTGNLKLEANGGLPDANTMVIINGVTMTFTLTFSADFPTTSKFANVAGVDLRGKQAAIITAANGKQFIFIIDGSGTRAVMNALPSGAMSVNNVSTTTPVLVCFLRGTLIETPQGPRAIETLQIGDLISTYDGQTLPLRWIGHRHVTAAELFLYPELCPIVLPQDMFGPGLPNRRLKLSPSHRVAIGGWETDLLFGFDTALMRANHLLFPNALPGQKAARVNPNRSIEYFQLLFDEHTLVLANGLACESFQLGARGELALDADDMAALDVACPNQGLADLMARLDCLPTLKAMQTKVLLNWSETAKAPEAAPKPETVARAVAQLAA